MKNNSNIYDIDGELIRKIDDTHMFTLEEAQEKIKTYNRKLDELEKTNPNDPKLATYRNYIINLTKYVWGMYNASPREVLEKAVNEQYSQEDMDKQIESAINDLKKELENEPKDDITEEITQEDLLVDNTNRPETVMDEYVNFEEV